MCSNLENTYSSPLVKPHHAGTESRRYRHVIFFFQTYVKIFKIQIFHCRILIQRDNEYWPGHLEITLQFWNISNIWTSTGHFSFKLLQNFSKFELFYYHSCIQLEKWILILVEVFLKKKNTKQKQKQKNKTKQNKTKKKNPWVVGMHKQVKPWWKLDLV